MIKLYTDCENKIGIFKSNELIIPNVNILDELILNNSVVTLFGINYWGLLVKDNKGKDIKIKYGDISNIKIV